MLPDIDQSHPAVVLSNVNVENFELVNPSDTDNILIKAVENDKMTILDKKYKEKTKKTIREVSVKNFVKRNTEFINTCRFKKLGRGINKYKFYSETGVTVVTKTKDNTLKIIPNGIYDTGSLNKIINNKDINDKRAQVLSIREEAMKNKKENKLVLLVIDDFLRTDDATRANEIYNYIMLQVSIGLSPPLKISNLDKNINCKDPMHVHQRNCSIFCNTNNISS